MRALRVLHTPAPGRDKRSTKTGQSFLSETAHALGLSGIVCVFVKRGEGQTAPRLVVSYANSEHIDIASSARDLMPIEWSRTSAATSMVGALSPLAPRHRSDLLFSISKIAGVNTWDAHQRVRLLQFQMLAHRTAIAGAMPRLTPREEECLRWAAEGKTMDDTAEIIGISCRGVRFHLDRARLKLNATNLTHAVARALQHDLLSMT